MLLVILLVAAARLLLRTEHRPPVRPDANPTGFRDVAKPRTD